MILAKLKTKISPKMQNLGQSGPYNCFVFLLITSFKFAPKSIHQMARIQFQKYKIFQLLRGAPDTPLCVEASYIWHCDAPPPQQIKKKVAKRWILGCWLGGTCNFEVGEEFEEGFCRQRLALGNNSDFLEE